MDWANERFVRLFTRDTPEWLCWVWQARALWPHLIRKADRSGVIANKLGARGLAALVGLPVEVVEAGLPDLVTDGCLQVHQLGYVIPNYLEAQETPQSDKQRQRESRERRRVVTKRDSESRNVTDSHAPSRGVTIGHSGPDLAEPDPDPEDQNSPSACAIPLAVPEPEHQQPSPGDGGQPGSGQPGPRAAQQGAATPGQEATAQGAVPAAGNVAEPRLGPIGHRVEHPPSLGGFVPTVSPPPAIRKDIARAIAGDRFEASKSTAPSLITATCSDQRPVANRDVKPANLIRPTVTRADLVEALAGPYSPDDPRARGWLAETTWRRVSDARLAVAAEIKLPAPLPLDEITPASRPRGFDELSTRIREAGARAPEVCDRVVANLVKQARAKRSLDWLSERAFGDKPWVNARDGIDPSARPVRPANGRPEAPSMPTPPKFAPEAPLKDPVRDAGEFQELFAKLTGERAPPAARPTPEVHELYGDGPRAPPDGTFPDDERKQPKRKAGT